MMLDVVGDGPEMDRLRGTVECEAIGAGVRLPGWVDHRELRERLVQSDVFAFPSIREFGGGVVLEAMAAGLAPVVVAYGGPAELVTPATGYLVPMSDRAGIVAAFRKVLAELADDPGAAERIGRRAQERVYTNFTWDAKAAQVVRVYDWVLGRAEKPDFGMPLPDAEWAPRAAETAVAC
jgi:glycosyltransferase involved in cell wall biosynthesis